MYKMTFPCKIVHELFKLFFYTDIIISSYFNSLFFFLCILIYITFTYFKI